MNPEKQTDRIKFFPEAVAPNRDEMRRDKESRKSNQKLPLGSQIVRDGELAFEEAEANIRLWTASVLHYDGTAYCLYGFD
jgi:hypothetical protein